MREESEAELRLSVKAVVIGIDALVKTLGFPRVVRLRETFW